jgi:hypothetical protein
MPTAAFTTLGCKVNQYETQKILERFEALGFEIVPFDAPADVYVINTCSVTQTAEAKSRQTVRRAARQNPNAVVVMTGCYAQFTIRRSERLEEAHLVVPNPDKLRTAEYLLEHFPHFKEQLAQARQNGETPIRRRSRAVLKIQDGCNIYCSFCSIPYTRPVMRSTPYTEVLDEAHAMVEDGYREIVLTGVLIGDYGPKTGSGGPDLADLCALLGEIEGLERIRISSIEPTQVSDRLIELIATHPKMCPHLHIPLQSGDSGILKAMNRPYDQAFYSGLDSSAARANPELRHQHRHHGWLSWRRRGGVPEHLLRGGAGGVLSGAPVPLLAASRHARRNDARPSTRRGEGGAAAASPAGEQSGGATLRLSPAGHSRARAGGDPLETLWADDRHKRPLPAGGVRRADQPRGTTDSRAPCRPNPDGVLGELTTA